MSWRTSSGKYPRRRFLRRAEPLLVEGVGNLGRGTAFVAKRRDPVHQLVEVAAAAMPDDRSGSHFFMTRKVLDGTQSVAKLVTRGEQRRGTLAGALAINNPLRDERSPGDAIDIERPEDGHERPEEQFSFPHPALHQRGDHVPSKPALHG
jgi:hypothetical protein